MKDEITFTGLPRNIDIAFDVDSSAFIYFSQELLALLELAEAPTLNAAEKLLHENDREYLIKTFNEVLIGNYRGDTQFSLNTKDRQIWVRLVPFLVNSSNGQVFAASILDITDEMQTLLTTQKYANKKNALLTLLAHDIRGPLAIANSLTAAVRSRLVESEFDSTLDNISKILVQTIDLVTDLAQREIAETMDVELVKKSIDIAVKAKEYIEEYSQSAKLIERKFVFSSSHNSIFIDLDESKMMQVFNNLMTNALKFTKAGDTIKMDIQDRGAGIQIFFSDNGIGIPPDLRDKIFDKFTEAGRPGLKGEQSIGLGLHIVKTIISWHKGTIQCESEENKGTTFLVEIPKSEKEV